MVAWSLLTVPFVALVITVRCMRRRAGSTPWGFLASVFLLTLGLQIPWLAAFNVYSVIRQPGRPELWAFLAVSLPVAGIILRAIWRDVL